MKTLIIVSLLIVGGLTAWMFWPENNIIDVSRATASPSPTANYDVDYFTPTPTPVVAGAFTPTPIATPKRTPSPTAPGLGGSGPRPVRTPVMANMVAINSSDEYGVVALTASSNDLAVISFNMDGAPIGLRQQASIVSGTCSNLGGTVYSLNPLMNGSSSTTLNVDFLDVAQSQTRLAVVVYGPENSFQIPYSCGQLR